MKIAFVEPGMGRSEAQGKIFPVSSNVQTPEDAKGELAGLMNGDEHVEEILEIDADKLSEEDVAIIQGLGPGLRDVVARYAHAVYWRGRDEGYDQCMDDH